MPRHGRVDCPGMLHHVMNRGLARRTVFETKQDARFFLALLAREVRRGRSLADGTKPGLPYVAPSRVLEVVTVEARFRPLRCRVGGTRERDAWPVLACGLLRELAGLTYAAITRQTNCTPSTATKRHQQHRSLMVTDRDYRRRCAELATKCLRCR